MSNRHCEIMSGICQNLTLQSYMYIINVTLSQRCPNVSILTVKYVTTSNPDMTVGPMLIQPKFTTVLCRMEIYAAITNGVDTYYTLI